MLCLLDRVDMGVNGLRILVVEDAPEVRAIKVVVISGESPPALTRALGAGAEVAFAKPCQWARVLTYLDGLSLAPTA
jgi:hypothetical protein